MRFSVFFAAVLVSFLSVPALAAGQPGQFDYYLLNLSWEPEFCHSARNSGSEECKQAEKGFVVHGLWPQYVNGYPEHCSNAHGPANTSSLLDIFPTAGLANHEWSTHGTCSGMQPDKYFDRVRQAYNSIVIPDMLKAPSNPQNLAPAAIKQAFIAANSGLRYNEMAVSCGNNYLTAVEFCLNKNDLSFTTCGQVRDCRARTVRITPLR